MLADRLEEWAVAYKAEGMEEGMRLGMEQGMRLGMEQAMRLGMRLGVALALRKLLTKRCGAIPADIAARIEAASAEEIDAWFDRAIEAASFDDVFGPTLG